MKPFQFVPWHYHRPPRTYFESWLRFHPVVGHGDEDDAVAAEVFKMVCPTQNLYMSCVCCQRKCVSPGCVRLVVITV